MQCRAKKYVVVDACSNDAKRRGAIILDITTRGDFDLIFGCDVTEAWVQIDAQTRGCLTWEQKRTLIVGIPTQDGGQKGVSSGVRMLNTSHVMLFGLQS